MYPSIHPSMHACMHASIHSSTYMHCIALHCIALHCIALHYITLHTYYLLISLLTHSLAYLLSYFLTYLFTYLLTNLLNLHWILGYCNRCMIACCNSVDFGFSRHLAATFIVSFTFSIRWIWRLLLWQHLRHHRLWGWSPRFQTFLRF